MISIRRRKYIAFIVDFHKHDLIIEWKKESREATKPLPADLYVQTIQSIGQYFDNFALLTVPAPSFHIYKNYPIWEVAKQVSVEMGIKLEKLFPEKSGKERMHKFGGLTKKVQDIECPPGKFVLILDDLYTTGGTAKVSIEAVIKRGSFPCFVAIA